MKLVKTLVAVMAAGAVVFGAAASASADSGKGAMTAELQGIIEKLSTEQQAALYLFLKEFLNTGGAPAAEAAAPAAPSKEEITKVLADFGAAARAGDVDKMASYFSDSFSHPTYGDKNGIKEFLKQAKDMGYLDGIEVDLADAEVKADGELFTIYPVDVQGAFGSITFEYVVKKENGEWRVVEMDAAGL